MSLPMHVLKLGGSLLDWPRFPLYLDQWINVGSSSRLVLVVGGGPFAEAVRQFDRLHRLGEARAHVLALRAMELSTALVEQLVPQTVIVDRLDHLPAAWSQSRWPIVTPGVWLDEGPEPLPHTWEVTSDSIAARLAERLGAETLTLLKSVSVPLGTTLEQAAERGVVDRWFPRAARGIARVRLVNLRDPEWRAVPLTPAERPGPNCPRPGSPG